MSGLHLAQYTILFLLKSCLEIATEIRCQAMHKRAWVISLNFIYPLLNIWFKVVSSGTGSENNAQRAINVIPALDEEDDSSPEVSLSLD